MKTWSHERLGLFRGEAGKLSWSCERQINKFGIYSVKDGALVLGGIRYIT